MKECENQWHSQVIAGMTPEIQVFWNVNTMSADTFTISEVNTTPAFEVQEA